MRFLIKTVFTLVLLAVLAVAAITFLVPTDVVRDQITAAIKDQTGRDLTVAGETSFSFYPSIGVRLGDVSLSNPPGMAGGPMARMAALELDLKLLPILTRNVEVERFVLVRPIFDLRVDGSGRRNWDFERLAAREQPHDLRAERRPALAQTHFVASLGEGSLVHGIRLGDVRIEDGIVRFTDERARIEQQLEAINLTLVLERITEPLAAKGDMVWQGEKVEIDGRVESLPALMGEEASAVKLDLQSAHVAGTFEGSARFGKALRVTGQLAGASPSVRDLAAWLGNDLRLGGFGAGKLSGRIEATGEQISFTGAKLTLDGMTGEGNASVRLAGVKPYIRAAMTFDKIDLNTYLGAAPAAAKPRARGTSKSTSTISKTTSKTTAPRPRSDQSLTDFIEELNQKDDKEQDQRQPAVRGWSQKAFDFAALGTVDADVKLTAGELIYRKIKAGQSAVTATLKNGVLTADLNDLRLYKGRGTGRLKLSGAGAVPQLSVRLDLENVQALPILEDAMAFNWISGKGNLAVVLSGAGRSESEMVRSLQGNGNLAFADGAIEGINIPKIVRGLKSGRFSGWKREASEKTDFSSLTGTFTMQNGVARNDDLKLIGPLVRLSGAGTVDTPGEALDYSIEPRIVASLEGQGSDDDLRGIVLPFRVHGPWDRPKVTPDLKRLLQNPDQAVDTAKKIGNAVKKLKNNKDFGNMIRGFLGQQGGTPAEPPAAGQAAETPTAQPDGTGSINPEDVIRQFFRR